MSFGCQEISAEMLMSCSHVRIIVMVVGHDSISCDSKSSPCALQLDEDISMAYEGMLKPVCLQIAPKDDELKACQQYTGRPEDLSPPEQFLLTMSTVPRLHDKINVLILMAQFQVPAENSPISTLSSHLLDYKVCWLAHEADSLMCRCRGCWTRQPRQSSAWSEPVHR